MESTASRSSLTESGHVTSYRLSDYEPHVEKRRHERRRVRLRAEARRLDNTLLAQRSPRLSLTLVNISQGGLAATSRSPVEEGERLAVLLPVEAGIRAERAIGRVIRCSPSRNGWSLAIRFDLQHFAA